MTALPVITAMGGINAAGRSALHFGFQRLVFDALPDAGRRRPTPVLDDVGRFGYTRVSD